MNKQTLDRARFIIPGIMISATIYFVMNGIGSTSENPLNNYFFYLLSLFFSVLYYAFNIRDFLWRKLENRFFMQYISMCFDNIKKGEKIPNPCVSCLFRQKPNNKDNNLNDNRRLFFEFIDEYAVLKEKSHQVMLNGCILSSVIDLCIICLAVVVAEIIFCHLDIGFDMNVLIICASLILLTPIVVYKLTKKHLLLIKSQMNSVKKDWFDEKKDRKHIKSCKRVIRKR